MTYSNLSQIPSIVGIVVWLVIFRRLENYVVRQILVSFFALFVSNQLAQASCHRTNSI